MSAVSLGLIGLGEWPRDAYVPILKEHPAANVIAVVARRLHEGMLACAQSEDEKGGVIVTPLG